MGSAEDEEWRQGIRPPTAVSPPRHGDKVAGHTSHRSGHVARAALLEQGQAGWHESSLLSACHKSAPKQTLQAAVKPVEEIN